MIRVDVCRAVLIAALGGVVAASRHELWMLYVVAFLLGVGETFYDTCAQSVMPNLVASDHLERANGRLYAVELTANQFAGPALGGLVVGIALAAGLWATAGAYLVAAGVVVTIVGTFHTQRSEPTRIHRDIIDGVRYLARHELLRALAVSNLASSAMFAVLPLYVLAPGPVGLTSAGYGLLFAAVAAGSVIGALLVTPLLDRLGQRRALLIAMTAAPGFSLAPAITATVWWIGAPSSPPPPSASPGTSSPSPYANALSPDELLGRVNAGYRLVAWGTMPIGAVIAALVADRFGIIAVFWASTALAAACVPIIFMQVTADRLYNSDGPASTGRPGEGWPTATRSTTATPCGPGPPAPCWVTPCWPHRHWARSCAASRGATSANSTGSPPSCWRGPGRPAPGPATHR